MPCYRCGTRQTDPDRGASPWRRGVKTNRQVLVCPDCQAAGGWQDDLDRCSACGSTRLVRRLGEIECYDCGEVGDAVITDAPDVMPGQEEAARQEMPADPGAISEELEQEIEQALARLLNRPRAARSS